MEHPAKGAAPGIRAVIFDFGGVLTESPFVAFADYEAEHDLPEGALRTLNATDHHVNAWAGLERGELSVEQFARQFEAEALRAGYTVDGEAVLALLDGELRPAMVEAVRACRERYVVGMITNNFRREAASPAPEPRQAVLALFDVVVQSREVGVRKPEPAIYGLALERLGVRASEAVFVDDLGVNLKPAREMGIHTIKFVTESQALGDLGELLGLDLKRPVP